jgi:hypothetical protein
MQQLMAHFWWGSKREERKIHWLAWEKMCTPKSEGGLGFRHMKAFNLSLLAKQEWQLMRHPESLVAQLLKAKYFPTTTFMQPKVEYGCSFTWRSLMAGKGGSLTRSAISSGLW